MKKLLLLCQVLLVSALGLLAQPGKGPQPTATHSLVIVQLRDFERKPIPKAELRFEDATQTGSPAVATGKTDREGNLQILLPIGRSYWIAVGDSNRYNQVTVPPKPYSITKHTVYFQGSLNGKPLAPGTPNFDMMPPMDGQAVIDIEFVGNQGQPLVHEVVKLIADGSKKEYVDSTGTDGKLRMRVPIGENYTMHLTYLSQMEHFSFPAHGGSYNVRVRYGYAGRQAIEAARAKRISDQLAFDAYLQLHREEQLKNRDADGHKLEFRATPIRSAEAPFQVTPTTYGHALTLADPSPVMSPCYIDGKIVAGAGWSSTHLAAVDATTGEPAWTVALTEGGISNIEGKEDVVVCATESCTIYVIAAKTGKLLWSKWLASYVLSAPCIADGKLYMCYEDATGADLVPEKAAGRNFAMACFDLHTGAILWQQWVDGEVMSSPMVVGNKLYFNTFAGHSYVLNAENGKVLADEKLYATSAPTYLDGHLYMAQRDSNSLDHFERIAMFDASNLQFQRGTEFQVAPHLDAKAMQKTAFAAASNSLSLATGYAEAPLNASKELTAKELVGALTIFAQQSWEGARPLAFGGKLYCVRGHVLQCRDAKTMTQVWEWLFPKSIHDDGAAVMSPPILVDGKVVVACLDGVIREFDPQTGRILKNHVTGERHRQQPLAAEGNYYAPCANGKLAVVKTDNKDVDHWHCWGGNPARTNQPVAPTPEQH